MIVRMTFIILYFLSGNIILVSGRISCGPKNIEELCPDNNTCVLDENGNGVCECLPESRMINGKCIPDVSSITSPPVTASARVVTDVPQSQHKVSNSAVVSGVLAAIVLAALAGALIYIAHRYRWLHWIRQRRQRQYDEMHIGREDDDDDDPPIA